MLGNYSLATLFFSKKLLRNMQDCRMNSKFADLIFFLSILTGENFVNFDRSLSKIFLEKTFTKLTGNYLRYSLVFRKVARSVFRNLSTSKMELFSKRIHG